MGLLQILTSNYLINVAFVAWCSAQIIKTLLYYVLTKEWNLERLMGAGGMPSSHSALVCSLCIAMARSTGFDSPEFALSMAFAGIVMYDAMGVRRAAGEQAKLLNQLVITFRKREGEDFAKVEPPKRRLRGRLKLKEKDRQLKEFLGHTPFEVLGGALLGILVAMIMPMK